MADNVELDSMSGGATVAAEDISGVEYQRIKIVNGQAGSSNGLTITTAGAARVDGSAVTQPVSMGAGSTLSTVSNVLMVNAGTITTIGSIAGGTVNTVSVLSLLAAGTVTTVGNLAGGTITTLGSIAGGTVNTVSVLSLLAAGTVTTVGNLAGGTITTLGSISGGTVNTVTTVGNIAGGSVTITGAPPVSHSVLLYNGTNALTTQFAVINATASGTNTIVTGTAGKKILVLDYSLTVASSVAIQWQSGTTNTNISGSMTLASGIKDGFAYGIMQTAFNQDDLRLNLSSAVAVQGRLTYVTV